MSVKSVLCVDDNNDSLELLKIFFDLEGYKAVACSTHQECFDYIKTNEFSAIVLDAWLAEKSGFEICCEIRAANKIIPIIFYTADATGKGRELGLQAGANAYLTKPNDLENLVPTVSQLIIQNPLAKADNYYLPNSHSC